MLSMKAKLGRQEQNFGGKSLVKEVSSRKY